MNAYLLFGIDPFEDDPGVIASAADRCTKWVQAMRTYCSGESKSLCEQILGELSEMRDRLLDVERKDLYDRVLRNWLPKRGLWATWQ